MPPTELCAVTVMLPDAPLPSPERTVSVRSVESLARVNENPFALPIADSSAVLELPVPVLVPSVQLTAGTPFPPPPAPIVVSEAPAVMSVPPDFRSCQLLLPAVRVAICCTAQSAEPVSDWDT